MRFGPPICLIALAGLLVLAPSAGAATITPNITSDELSDNDDCSLREAVVIANANDPAGIEDSCAISGTPGVDDTIMLGAFTYELSLGPAGDTTAMQGDLDATGADGLTIQGAGAGATTITRGGALVDRLFEAREGVLEVHDLTLTNGMAPDPQFGGAVLVSGPASLELHDSVVSMSSAAHGGGIAFSTSTGGQSTIVNSRVTGNGTLPGGQGGGIFAFSTGPLEVEVTDSDIHMNTAERGGGIFNQVDMTVSGSRIRDNEAVEDPADDGSPAGGGIDSADSNMAGNLTVTRSAITGNTVTSTDPDGDGAQTVGGGLRTTGGSAVVRDSLISGNALENQGTMETQTQTGAGVAIRSGTIVAAIVNSTISGNSAPADSSSGGGIYTFEPTTLRHTTLADNEAATGNAVRRGDLLQPLNVGSSILTGPGPNVCSTGAITSLDYNIASGGTCTGLTEPNDMTGTDPMIAPALSDNGADEAGAPGFLAPLQTHALLPTSLAVDHVPIGSSFISPENTFAAIADILGFLFLVVGVFWIIEAFAAREVNELWWMGLIAGILMVALAFYTGGQFFIEKQYVLLVFAGIWALMSGVTDIVRAFQIRNVGRLI